MSLNAEQYTAAQEAKNKVKILLENVPQVCGVGITQVDQHYAVKVNLQQELDPKQTIPDQMDGIPIVVHVTGPIRKLGPQTRR